MLDSFFQTTLKYLKSHFWCENVKSLPLLHNVILDVITFPKNLLTTSGLLILLHGVISLPDANH